MEWKKSGTNRRVRYPVYRNKKWIYLVKTREDGYSVQKEGEDQKIDFVFNETENSWSLESNGESYRFLKYTSGDELVIYLPDGQEITVEASPAGVLALQKIAGEYASLAIL